MQNIDKDLLWNSILDCLKNYLSVPGFQTFFSSAKPINLVDNILQIEVINAFSKEWIREKCEPILRNFLKNNLNQMIIFDYIVKEEKEIVNNDTSLFSYILEKNNPQSHNNDSILNPKYTFENFIVGLNNRFAYAASEAVVKAPAKAYNPLFIYGSVGLGKTHLLHAIGLKIKELHPKLKISCVSSEKFTNDLINSIKDKKTDSFRGKYRTVDILLVDDIQFLAGKEQTQEEFFHTFNDLHGKNKQIVITSDRPPREIPTLEDRLRTRFGWGLIADIQPPDLETRIAILRKKIELNNFNIQDEILHYIATQIPTNVREMEGALTRIVAYASLLNTEVTLSIASNVIKDMIGIKSEKPLTIATIKRKTSEYFQISENDLCAKTRAREIVFARQISMYLARELTNVSLPKIGENFGNRDHTTVMHACDKIKTMLNNDEQTKNIINLLIINIKNED
ncbi:MAG: chromosomal replication initiator protein DnaA [Candidatus Margulisiibacteriota bacterium]|jgi:chromosomal replication initiator protein